MTCPNEISWLRAEFGELTVNETEALERHQATCPACRDLRRANRALLDDLSERPELGASEDAFLERVMSVCERSPSLLGSRPKTRAWTLGSLAALATAAAFLVLVGPRFRSSSDHVTARGFKHAREADSVSVQALVVRGKEIRPLEGALLHPGDGIAVRYRNTDAEPRYLAVFAVDAEKGVHWIHPAYVDPSTNPVSITLPLSADDDLLGEVVEPERPATGPLRVVAIVSGDPLSVKEIEERLSRGEGPTPGPSSPNRVREWSCTWNAR